MWNVVLIGLKVLMLQENNMKPSMNPRTVKVALKLAAVMLVIASGIVAKLSLGEQLSISTVVSIIQTALGAALDGT